MKKVALPLFPQFGLEPNVYYIPPVHVPPPYLRQMFGHGVPEAIETYRTASENIPLLGALLLFGAVPDIIHHYRAVGAHAIGYDADGGELVRVPISEPIHVRAVYDEQYQTFRTNIT